MAIIMGFPPSNTISPGPRLPYLPPDHGTRATVIDEQTVRFGDIERYIAALDPWKVKMIRTLLDNQSKHFEKKDK